jgi:hypothetical protein
MLDSLLVQLQSYSATDLWAHAKYKLLRLRKQTGAFLNLL